MKTTAKNNLIILCESAIMIALATVLGLFKFSLWAQGGSIDFCMAPLLVLAYRRGAKVAIPAGMAYGLVDCLITGGIGWGLPSILLDYVLAYGAVGIGGFFRKMPFGLALGTVMGSLARFAVHFVSGITIYKIAFGSSMEIFGMTFGHELAALYSLIYNGSYMLGDCILSLALVLLFNKNNNLLKRM